MLYRVVACIYLKPWTWTHKAEAAQIRTHIVSSSALSLAPCKDSIDDIAIATSPPFAFARHGIHRMRC